MDGSDFYYVRGDYVVLGVVDALGSGDFVEAVLSKSSDVNYQSKGFEFVLMAWVNRQKWKKIKN